VLHLKIESELFLKFTRLSSPLSLLQSLLTSFITSVFGIFTNRRKNGQQVNAHLTGTPSSVVNAVSMQANGSSNKSNTLPLEDYSKANDPTNTREIVSDTFTEHA